jgi:hypothetical protein
VLGIPESRFLPAVVETVRIISVNVETWTVDAISEYGEKKFYAIQIMSPYFHFMNGEGIYTMPEVGALAWVCKPSSGSRAAPFLLGFQAPFDETNAGFRVNRPPMNPGDIMMRTRDENFITLRRGGVVQIGANPISQRIYLPILNYIKDFCENYQLSTFGGEITWTTERVDQSSAGEVGTRFALLAREKASDPQHIASLTIGSHGEDSATILDLKVLAAGAPGAVEQVRLTLGKDGNVTWQVQDSWDLTAQGSVSVTAQTGSLNLSSPAGATQIEAGESVDVKAATDVLVEAGGTSTDRAAQKIVDSPVIRLGSSAAKNPVVKGSNLVSFLDHLITAIEAIQAPSGPVVATAVTLLRAELSTLISSGVFVE